MRCVRGNSEEMEKGSAPERQELKAQVPHPLSEGPGTEKASNFGYSPSRF